MKIFRNTAAIAMAITLTLTTTLTSGTAFASSDTAAAPAVTTTPAQNSTATQPAATPDVIKTHLESMATVEKVTDDGKQLTVKIDDQILVLNIGTPTLFIHAKTGLPSSLKDIRIGDNIYVTYNSAMTRSIPPQSSAIAIVTGVEKNKTIPKLMTVKELVDAKENQIRFLNTDGDMIVTLLKDKPITPFKTKQIATYKDIQPGSKVFVWFDIVLMSYPGQTTAERTVLVSSGETIAKTPVSITVNGKKLKLEKAAVIERHGKYLVPLKAVANALDFELKWNARNKTASLDNGLVKTTVTVGKDAYYKASSKAIGLTNTFSYGASPEIVSGTLYVPADLFKLLYSNDGAVMVEGDTLCIRTMQ